jgi:hypothetical protein
MPVNWFKNVLFAGLIIGLAGCSNSGFEGVTGSNQSDDPEEKPKGKKQEDGLVFESVEGDEEEEATTPTEIAGAFLTRTKCSALKADSSLQIKYGCVLELNGKKFKLDGYDAVGWFHTSSYNQYLTKSQFEDQPAESEFHVVLTASEADSNWSTVSVELEKDGKSLIRSDSISYAQSNGTDLEVQPPIQEVIGKTEDFRLGNGTFDFGANTDCWESEMQKPLSGKRMTIPFKIDTDGSKVAITLQKMCGLRYSSNRVQIIQGFNVVKSVFLPPRSDSFRLEVMEFAAGDYEIRIESLYNNSQNDRDDFVVGEVVVTGSNFTIGQSYPSN